MGSTVSTIDSSRTISSLLCSKRRQNSSKEKSTKNNVDINVPVKAIITHKDKLDLRRKSYSLTDLPTCIGEKGRNGSASDLGDNIHDHDAKSISSSVSFDNGRSVNTFGSGVVGLRNLGNTCFMNSVLQCLCKTKPLRRYFWKKRYKKDLNTHAQTKGRLARAFGRLMDDIWSSRDPDYISPSTLKSEIRKYAHQFSGYHAHDAHEFLLFLIEGIHDDLNAVKIKPKYSLLEDSHVSNDGEISDLHWERYLTRERSVIQDLFVGQLKCTLTCSVCENRSVTFDPFWDLSLPVPLHLKTKTKNDISISDCLGEFTHEEILDDDEKPTCEKCNEKRKCIKKILIERFPKILVIHLKRFAESRTYHTLVDFPHELDLSEFAGNSQGHAKQNPVYTLYGISNHTGGTNVFIGHYTAFCRHPDTGIWHVHNDARVKEMPMHRVVSSSAYVIFYELNSNDCKEIKIC